MADRIVTAFMMLSLLAWFVFIPIEVFYLKLLPTPQFAVSVCGGMLSLVGFAIVIATIYKNPFAIQVVEDQTERGQVLIDTGPYAYVRHPMYLGLLPFLAGIALWLESYASVIALTVILVILIARIVVEEKTLWKTILSSSTAESHQPGCRNPRHHSGRPNTPPDNSVTIRLTIGRWVRSMLSSETILSSPRST